MQRSNKRSRKQNRRRINLRRLVPFVFFLIVAVVAAGMLVDYGVKSMNRSRENERLAHEYSAAFVPAAAEPPAGEETSAGVQSTPLPTHSATQTPPPALLKTYRSLQGKVPEQAHKLYKLNNDLVGWLYINDLVDLPVVYRDNEYYLTHAFNEEEDSGGTLFLDENHPLKEETQHLVIHGHNMYDDSMFGMVAGYTRLATVKENAFARFSTLYAPEEYVIFAVLRVNPDPASDDFFNYIGKPNFADVNDFNAYVGALRERSMFEIPVDVRPSDALLTLATCVDDDRLAVVFRRVRDGETRAELQVQVDMAYKKQD